MFRVSTLSMVMVMGMMAVLALSVVLPVRGVLAQTQTCGPNNFVGYPTCDGIFLSSKFVTVTATTSPYGLTTSYATCVANKMHSTTFNTFLLAGSYTFQFNYNTFGSSTGSGVAIYYGENTVTFPNFVGAVFDISSSNTQFNFNFSVPNMDTYSFAIVGFNNNNSNVLDLDSIAIVCAANNPNCFPVTSASWPQLAPKLSSPVNLSGIIGFAPMSSFNCLPISNLLLVPTSTLGNGVSVSGQDLYAVCRDEPSTLRAYRGLTRYSDSWPLPSGLSNSDVHLIQPYTVNNPTASSLIYLLSYSNRVYTYQVYSFQLTSGNFTLVAQLPRFIWYSACQWPAFVSWLGLHVMCRDSTDSQYKLFLVTLNSTSPETGTTIVATGAKDIYAQVTATGTIAIALSDYTNTMLLTYLPRNSSWTTLKLPIPDSTEVLAMDAQLNLYYLLYGDNQVFVRNSSTAYTTFINTPIITPESRCLGPIQMIGGGSNPPNLYVQCKNGVFRFQWQPSTSSYLSSISIGGIGSAKYDFVVSSDESVLLLLNQDSRILTLKRPANTISALTVDALAASEPVGTNLPLFPTAFNYQLSNYFLYLDSEYAAVTSIQFNLQCSAGSTQVAINSGPGVLSVANGVTVVCGSSVVVPISTGLTSMQLTYTSIVSYANNTGNYSATYNYRFTINKSPSAVPFQLAALQQGRFHGSNIAFVNNSVFFVELPERSTEIERFTISDALPLPQAVSSASELDIQPPQSQCQSVTSMTTNTNGVVVLSCYSETLSRYFYVSSLDSGDTWTGWIEKEWTYNVRLALITLNDGTTLMYAACFDSLNKKYGVRKYLIDTTGGIAPIGECILSNFWPSWFTALPNGDVLFSSDKGILSVYTTATGSSLTVSLPSFCFTPTDSAVIGVPTEKEPHGNYTVAVACGSRFDTVSGLASTDYGHVMLVTGSGAAWSTQVLSSPSLCISPGSVFVDAAANLYAVCGLGNSLIRWNSSVISAALIQPQKLSPQELSQLAVIFFAGNANNAFIAGRGLPNNTANGQIWIALLGADSSPSTFLMQIGSTPTPTSTTMPTSTPTSTVTTTPGPSNNGTSQTPLVVGVVVGVVGLGIIAAAAVVVKRRRQNRTGERAPLRGRQIQVTTSPSARSPLL